MHTAYLRHQLMDGHRRTGELFACLPARQRPVLANQVGFSMQHVDHCMDLNRLWCGDYHTVETWWSDRGYEVPIDPEEAVFMLRSWQKSKH